MFLDRFGHDEDFLPVHAEGRAGYWFGDQPFDGDTVVRPNLFVVGGLGQVITPIETTVLEDGVACQA